MSIDPTHKYTLEEWREMEIANETKYDYWDGLLVDARAMAGRSMPHTRIVGNAFWRSANELEAKDSSCEAFVSELKVELGDDRHYVYPDATISCDPEPGGADGSIVNPVVVFEAVSKTSAGYDFGGKWKKYRRIPSIREYVLIDSRGINVEHRRRRSERQDIWRISHHEELTDVIELASVGISLSLKQLYERVAFASAS